MKPSLIFALTLASTCLLGVGCSSSGSAGSSNADAGPAGGPISGAPDNHCANVPTVVVDPAACNGDTAAGGAPSADPGSGDSSAAGAADCNQTHDAEYGDTLPNSEGDDDDCKYHASWTSTPIRLNEPVTITLVVSDKSTGTPLAALADGKTPLTRLDVYEPCNPNRRGPAQNLSAKITQTKPGEFSVGPLEFDQSGRWVVRFHLYEQCVDGDTSPHGHIAFFVDVP